MSVQIGCGYCGAVVIESWRDMPQEQIAKELAEHDFACDKNPLVIRHRKIIQILKGHSSRLAWSDRDTGGALELMDHILDQIENLHPPLRSREREQKTNTQ